MGHASLSPLQYLLNLPSLFSLFSLFQPKRYPWAARHASSAWTLRYTSNKDSFDETINEIRRRQDAKRASRPKLYLETSTPQQTSTSDGTDDVNPKLVTENNALPPPRTPSRAGRTANSPLEASNSPLVVNIKPQRSTARAVLASMLSSP